MSRTGRRGRAGAVMSYLAFAAVAVATVAGLVAQPREVAGAPVADAPVADQVIVAGAVGLRWEDVDPEHTPHLWRLAQSGAIGSLSVRSAQQPTCPADGWLTLGAGNYAAGVPPEPAAAEPDTEPEPDVGPCPALEATIEPTEGAGAYLPDQEPLVRHNQWDLPWGAVPGALAGSVGCTVAVGEGAAVAGARSYGRIDRYHASLPEDPQAAARLLGERCELAIVDLGTIAGEGEPRQEAVARVDGLLGRVLAARPDGSLVLVAGVADIGAGPHLHVAVAEGPGLQPGWLTSATTERTGYLQLIDIAPTVLAAVDRPVPELLLIGHPADSRSGRPADLSEAVAELVSADQRAQYARPLSGWFLAGLALAELALFAAVVPLLREPAGPPGSRGRLLRRSAPVLLVAAALAIPAALVTGWVPWWRAHAAVGVFTATSLTVLAVACVLVIRTPLFRRTLGLVGAAAGVAAAAVGADLLTGSWLQLNGVVGYSAHDAGRYAGVSDIGLGVLTAGTLLVAGCVAEQVSRRRRPLVVTAIGACGVVLAGSPYLGADIGGAVALAVGVCVAAAMSTGGWVTATRVTWATGVGAAVLAAVAAADLQRPLEQRTGLGRMLTQLAEGTAGFGLQRISLDNVEAFIASPLTVLAIGAAVFIWWVLLRPWGGLRRLFGIHPALRAVLLGAGVAALLGGVMVGAALTVAGAAAAVGVPLLTLAALRLRERSAHRGGRAADVRTPQPSQVLE